MRLSVRRTAPKEARHASKPRKQRTCLQWPEVSVLVDGTRAQPGAPNGGQGVRRALEQGVIERGRLVTTGKPATGEHVLLRGVRGL